MLNCVTDTLRTVLALCTSPILTPSTPTQALGVALFVCGLNIELASELTRKEWKRDPSNKGKLYTGGLFGIVRHPNYAGFVLWQAGGIMVIGGLLSNVLVGAAFGCNMVNRAVLGLEYYCRRRMRLDLAVVWCCADLWCSMVISGSVLRGRFHNLSLRMRYTGNDLACRIYSANMQSC